MFQLKTVAKTSDRRLCATKKNVSRNVKINLHQDITSYQNIKLISALCSTIKSDKESVFLLNHWIHKTFNYEHSDTLDFNCAQKLLK